MAISTDTTRIVYTGNGSIVTPYAVPFRVQEVGHVRVSQRTNLEPDAPWTAITEGDYEVTLVPETGLAEVRTYAAYDNESDILIYRAVDFRQEREYPVSGPFPAKSHEGGLDKLTMLVQQLRAGLQSSIQIPDGSEQGGIGLLPLLRTGFIGFTEGLEPYVYTAAELLELLSEPPNPVYTSGLTVFPTASVRAATLPARSGQLGIQLSDKSLWVANSDQLMMPPPWRRAWPSGIPT